MWTRVRFTVVDSDGPSSTYIRSKLLNQSNSTPSIILTGLVTSMLALVSNRARFVITTSHLVVVSDGSWRVFQALSVEAWIPGALTPMMTVRMLLSSYSSSSWSLGSISILISVSPLSDDWGVQSHSSPVSYTHLTLPTILRV